MFFKAVRILITPLEIIIKVKQLCVPIDKLIVNFALQTYEGKTI